jgi:hypothetical protein
MDKNLSRARSGRPRTGEATITMAAERMIRQGADSARVCPVNNVLDGLKNAAAHVGAGSELNRAWDDAQAFLEQVWS